MMTALSIDIFKTNFYYLRSDKSQQVLINRGGFRSRHSMRKTRVRNKFAIL
jgi:gluconate kinase